MPHPGSVDERAQVAGVAGDQGRGRPRRSGGGDDSVGCRAGPARSNPSGAEGPQRARAWAEALVAAGARLVVPEIAHYEVRRELIRASREAGLRRLDILGSTLSYEPLTTAVMRHAAALWAEARNHGVPAAHDHALDGDVVLAAQALELAGRGAQVVVATTNPRHLLQHVDARVWWDVG